VSRLWFVGRTGSADEQSGDANPSAASENDASVTDRRIRRKLPRMNGARERTRTSTPLRELAPEAIFATSAPSRTEWQEREK
jgi:hypothetical protein